MSAYLVDETEILYLVEAGIHMSDAHGSLSWIWNHRYGNLPAGDRCAAERVGNMLWQENGRSVSYRYASHAAEPPPFRYRRIMGHIDPVQVLATCANFAYQASEHPRWKDSEAAAYIEALERAAICRLTETAIWGAPAIEPTPRGPQWSTQKSCVA